MLDQESDQGAGPAICIPSFARKEIGRGTKRIVFEHENPAYVVKVMRAGSGRGLAGCGMFAPDNLQEWENGAWILENAGSKWIAPCVLIEPSSVWLIQHRTAPVPAGVHALPQALTYDPNGNNYGILNGRIVCHDYAQIHRNGLQSEINIRIDDEPPYQPFYSENERNNRR